MPSADSACVASHHGTPLYSPGRPLYTAVSRICSRYRHETGVKKSFALDYLQFWMSGSQPEISKELQEFLELQSAQQQVRILRSSIRCVSSFGQDQVRTQISCRLLLEQAFIERDADRLTPLALPTQMQQTVSGITAACWDKCMSTPGRSMSSREESCLSDCAKRFIEATQFIVQRFQQKGGGM